MGFSLIELVVIGYQYHQEALHLIKSKNKKKIRYLEDTISLKNKTLSKFVKQLLDTDKARQRKGKLENEIKALELELLHCEKSKELVGSLGMMLLDLGEPL